MRSSCYSLFCIVKMSRGSKKPMGSARRYLSVCRCIVKIRAVARTTRNRVVSPGSTPESMCQEEAIKQCVAQSVGSVVQAPDAQSVPMEACSWGLMDSWTMDGELDVWEPKTPTASAKTTRREARDFIVALMIAKMAMDLKGRRGGCRIEPISI